MPHVPSLLQLVQVPAQSVALGLPSTSWQGEPQHVLLSAHGLVSEQAVVPSPLHVPVVEPPVPHVPFVQ